MPRDSGGIYSLPAGYLAVTGQPILASNHNPPLEDVRDALTGSLPRNGAAAMTGKLQGLASTTGSASINLAEGDTPSAPVDGDMWVEADSAHIRVNGVSFDLGYCTRKTAETTGAAVGAVAVTDIPAGTKHCRMVIYACQPSTDAVSLVLRASTNNGSSYLSGASDYGWVYDGGNSAGVGYTVGDGGDTELEIASLLESSSDDFMAVIDVFFKTSGRCFVKAWAHYVASDGSYNTQVNGGYVDFTVNAFQVFPTAGNFTSITYDVTCYAR
jgi:hypothetical protein